MKNMKKLLGAMAALGFTTVAAVNVVACGSPVAGNDLTKSFASSYTAVIDKKDVLNFPGTGLSAGKDEGKFNFKFADITIPTITTVLTQNVGSEMITRLVKEADPVKDVTPLFEGEQIAQITQNTKDGELTAATGAEKNVQYVVTLNLFKAVVQKKGEDAKFVSQNVSMDITVNVNTTAVKKDMKDLSEKAEVIKVQAGNIAGFEDKLKYALALTPGFEAMKRAEGITITDKSGNALDPTAIVATDALAVKVTAADSTYFNAGDKEVTVKINVEKESLDNLKASYTVPNVTAKDVASFKTELLKVLAKENGFIAIDRDKAISITGFNGKDLTADDIKAGQLSITVKANGSANFTDGNKTISADIEIKA